MNRVHQFAAIAVLSCGLLAPSVLAEESSSGYDWPNNTGHDFVAPAGDDLRLTKDHLNLRPLWSVDIHTGIGKGGSGTVLGVLEDGFEPTYGGTSSPVVAGGVVIQSWSQASGEIEAEPGSLTDRYFSNEERNEHFRGTFLRIDADWHTVAFDIDTGEKVWERIEPSAAMNFSASKRGHNGFNPAVGNGIYVTISFTGHVFAYDITDGSQVWSSNIGEWHEQAESYKAQMLESRTLPTPGDGPLGYDRSGAAIIDDLVLLPDGKGGMLALELSTGEQRWHLPEVLDNPMTPRQIEVDGQTMVLSLGQSDGRRLYAINPQSGEIIWEHGTGRNREQLILGDGVVVLNREGGGRDPVRLAAYQVASDGLNELWQMSDDEQFIYTHRRARAAERRAVIANGVLYIALGHGDASRRVMSFDAQSGKLLHMDEHHIHNNSGHPVIHGDKMFWQLDSSHSGPSGLLMYQLGEHGSFTRLGETTYRALGISLLTDYEHPIEIPFANGRAFVRGKTNFTAVDLRPPEHGVVDARFHNLWAGFHRPISARYFVSSEGAITQGAMESPPRNELGVPGSTAWRDDPWMPVAIDGNPEKGSAFSADSQAVFRAFAYSMSISMDEITDDGEWLGRWTRAFPGWDETLNIEGHLHESSEGGFARRGWPTGWLEHQPVTFFSDLKEGQERIFLQVHGFLPRDGDPGNVTICIDHDREQVVSAVAGGFSFNQSYHEFDGSQLEVDENGIRGTASMILNSDGWVHGDYRNETSLLGRIHLDVQFGEPNDNGIYRVTGSVSAEWGLSGTREGEIRATILRD